MFFLYSSFFKFFHRHIHTNTSLLLKRPLLSRVLTENCYKSLFMECACWEILTPGHEIFRHHFSIRVLRFIRLDGTGHKNPQVCLLNIYF